MPDAPFKRGRASNLPPMQARFVEEYLIDLNATQAAVRAGYKHADKQGPRLLGNVGVAAAIEKAKAARSERTEIKQDRVLQEIARLAFSDLRKCFTDGGSLLGPAEWDDDTAAALSAVEVITRPTGEKDEDGKIIVEHVHKLKLWDKGASLDKLMKHLGAYAPEKQEHTGKNGAPLIPTSVTHRVIDPKDADA